VDSLPLQAIGTGAVALVVALVLYFRVKAAPEGNAAMARIARFIREGAMAFLAREYKVLGVYAVVVGGLMAWKLGPKAAGAFVAGAFLSLLAGFFGMKSATYANVRTAEAARSSGKPAALVLALDGGAVMGLCVAGLGLIGMGGLFAAFRSGDGFTEDFGTVIHAFAVGASSIALFARIGGGIYTKAADVGADIVGKVEANIPEDDPRNPGVIADNVGDNVGDIAGMGADIYESYVAAVVSAMALGLTVPAENLKALAPDLPEKALRMAAISLPLLITTIGLAVSIVAIFITRMLKNMPPATVLRIALILPPFLVVGAAAVVLPMFKISMGAVFAMAAGAAGGAIIGLVTDYYTSMGPIRKIAESSLTGPGTNVIRGLAVGLESCAIPLATLCAVGSIANHFLGLYGVAMAAVGMLAGTAIVMTVDAYGPIADNGGGIAEMGGLGKEVRDITDELDAVGNTTAAVGKGFAIGSAVLTVVALFAAFIMEVNHVRVEVRHQQPLVLVLTESKILMGILFGSILPCIVGAATMTAVGRAAGAIVEEIRRQFREIPGLLEGKEGVEPQPGVIVDIATTAAIREMIFPGAVAVLAPVFIGFIAGPEVLAGALAGALAVGATLSLLMANAGGAWDNAKKYIEKGGLEGHKKGSDAHKAAVVGDTVGDPFKDTSGPGIAILIKVMSVVSLLIAPLIA